MFRILCLALSLMLALPLMAEETSSEDLFQKGLGAYKNKQFTEARDAFQSLLAQNPNSAELMHNLALSQYQLGEKAIALALWRKALAKDPGDRQMRAGREMAETELQQRNMLRFDSLRALSMHEVLWVLSLILGGCGYLWINYLKRRRTALEQELPSPGFPAMAFTFTLLLIAGVGVATFKIWEARQTRATITVTTAQARSLPSEESVPLFDVRGGSDVLVRRTAEGWVQVTTSDGNSGWVKNSELLITSGS